MTETNSTIVLRSLQGWFGRLLPEPWDVQLQRTEAMQRPCMVVHPSTPEATRGSAFVRDTNRDYEFFVYPVGYVRNPARSRMEAENTARTIGRAFDRGLKISGVYFSYAMRIPLFDYTAVAWDAPLPNGAVPFDYLALSNLTIDVRTDPDEDDLFTLIGSVRTRWMNHGDLRRYDGPLIQDVVVNHQGTLPTP